MALITIKTLEDIDSGAQQSRLRRLLSQVSNKLGIASDYKKDENSFEHAEDDDMLGQLDSDLQTHPNGGKGVVVTGAALTVILADEGIKYQFLTLAKACNVLIACRASPLQKSLVITMVRSGIKPEPITLAIGDGANDVAMIQTAHIGVGISGEEGLQAANNSDFAFAQFRFLKQLLLVHGHWNYRRIAIVILYSFYKNLAFVFTSFFLVLYTAWSGAPLYEGLISTSFNIFLATPILLVRVFDIYGYFCTYGYSNVDVLTMFASISHAR